MADKDIKIGIKTIGADTAAGAFRKVGDASEDMARATRQADLSPDKARVSEFAYYDLGAEIDKTRQKTETFTAGVTQLQQPTRNSAAALLMFSQGFEDAQYGIRGVLNNIPGLIIALGGTAGLAGAISIAAVSLSQIIPLFTETEEKASDMADKIKEIAENAGALEAERFEGLEEGIDIAAEAAEALKQRFTETKTASASLAISGVEDAGKIAEAQKKITELLGRQVDSFREIEASAARAEEKRKLIAQQQIDAERQKLVLAQEAETIVADNLGKKKALADTEAARLVQLKAQLESLREQKKILEEIAKGGGDFNNLPDSLQDFSQKALKSSRGPLDYRGAVKREAGRQAGDGGVLQAQVQAAEQRIDNLAEAISSLTKDGGIIEKAQNSLNAATAKVTDLTSAVATNVEKIESTLATDTIVAKTDALVASSEKFATDIGTAAEKVETNTVAGQQAKDSILKAAEDGKITADEQAKVAQSLQVLMGQLQSGQATFSGNIRDLISLQQEFLRAGQQNAIQIQQLKVQAQQQAAAINQLYSRIR